MSALAPVPREVISTACTTPPTARLETYGTGSPSARTTWPVIMSLVIWTINTSARQHRFLPTSSLDNATLGATTRIRTPPAAAIDTTSSKWRLKIPLIIPTSNPQSQRHLPVPTTQVDSSSIRTSYDP